MFGPMASTSNTFDESQRKYTWWHGLGFTEVKIACFYYWCCFNSAHLRCQWWLKRTWSPAGTITETPPRGYMGNIRAGGVIPDHHQITIMSLLTYIGRNGPNNTTVIMFGPMASRVLQIHWINLNPSTHCTMGCGWGWAWQGCYTKVITRSSQGHKKVNSA